MNIRAAHLRDPTLNPGPLASPQPTKQAAVRKKGRGEPCHLETDRGLHHGPTRGMADQYGRADIIHGVSAHYLLRDPVNNVISWNAFETEEASRRELTGLRAKGQLLVPGNARIRE
ncbi:hypothetical protein NDU88_004743 [Pleurodeles waltl]|uniref:Uncharacterized protein n=1 Tax=Pleurodeles waltl TaxID=8319 RepID=A0AAV7QG31_PLEWA|nr:hypothetical protein NDU88_004743 [Pleurodeles waltl]